MMGGDSKYILWIGSERKHMQITCVLTEWCMKIFDYITLIIS